MSPHGAQQHCPPTHTPHTTTPPHTHADLRLRCNCYRCGHDTACSTQPRWYRTKVVVRPTRALFTCSQLHPHRSSRSSCPGNVCARAIAIDEVASGVPLRRVPRLGERTAQHDRSRQVAVRKPGQLRLRRVSRHHRGHPDLDHQLRLQRRVGSAGLHRWRRRVRQPLHSPHQRELLRSGDGPCRQRVSARARPPCEW